MTIKRLRILLAYVSLMALAGSAGFLQTENDMKSMKIVNTGDETQDMVVNGDLVPGIAPGGYVEVTVPDGHIFRAEAHATTLGQTQQKLEPAGLDAGEAVPASTIPAAPAVAPVTEPTPADATPAGDPDTESKVAAENQAATITPLRNPVPAEAGE